MPDILLLGQHNLKIEKTVIVIKLCRGFRLDVRTRYLYRDNTTRPSDGDVKCRSVHV